MTHEEMQIALAYLAIRLPYGFLPGDIPGGQTNPAATRMTWNAYLVVSNPPLGVIRDFPDPDPDADPLPSYDVLLAAVGPARLVRTRRRILYELDRECRSRITKAYAAKDFEHELRRRLRGVATPEQDVERERLRATAYPRLIAWVQDAVRTHQELLDFNAAADSHWAVADDTR